MFRRGPANGVVEFRGYVKIHNAEHLLFNPLECRGNYSATQIFLLTYLLTYIKQVALLAQRGRTMLRVLILASINSTKHSLSVLVT